MSKLPTFSQDINFEVEDIQLLIEEAEREEAECAQAEVEHLFAMATA